MKKNNVWFITAKTNLHVGNENTSSYGLIDKAIQRDALTGLPCINSSSLKGAINEYASQIEELDSDKRIEIFGVDKTGEKKDTKKGRCIFFDAQILCLPKRSNDSLYKLVTSDEVINRFIEKMACFGIQSSKEELKSRFNIKTVSHPEFKELCDDYNLPIIARNCLENGTSKNLWYEQVLPSETVFYTFIDNKEIEELPNALKDKVVQIGANATIGYGYCKFSNLEK